MNLLNATKITNTKFPFPYVQLIICLLHVHVLLTPFIMAAAVKHYVMTPILAFMPVFALFSVNFIAAELEMPFGEDSFSLRCPPAGFIQKWSNSAFRTSKN